MCITYARGLGCIVPACSWHFLLTRIWHTYNCDDTMSMNPNIVRGKMLWVRMQCIPHHPVSPPLSFVNRVMICSNTESTVSVLISSGFWKLWNTVHDGSLFVLYLSFTATLLGGHAISFMVTPSRALVTTSNFLCIFLLVVSATGCMLAGDNFKQECIPVWCVPSALYHTGVLCQGRVSV